MTANGYAHDETRDLSSDKPFSPSTRSVLLSVVVGILGTAWSLKSLGLPGTTDAHLFNWHPPLLSISIFIIQPLALMIVRTHGRFMHVLLEVFALAFAIFGIVTVWYAHKALHMRNFYSAHSWFAFVTGFVAVVSIVLAFDGRKHAHRIAGRITVGAAFITAAMGFSEMQTLLIAKYSPFELKAVFSGLLAILTIVVGFVVVHDDHPGDIHLDEKFAHGLGEVDEKEFGKDGKSGRNRNEGRTRFKLWRELHEDVVDINDCLGERIDRDEIRATIEKVDAAV